IRKRRCFQSQPHHAEPSLLLYKHHPALIVVPPHPDPGLLLYKIYLHKGKQTQYAFPVISDKKLKKLESKEILALQAAKTEPLKDDHDAFTVVMGSKASEPTELAPPLLQLIEVSFSYPDMPDFRLSDVDAEFKEELKREIKANVDELS
ncbi:hypothetical protein HID58_077992, partial [Brassica napus]